ncbi:MAG TPA: hypothetical protein VJU77_03840 [Chthoniobacterales bacterium]|nr:hypothetical protein [Chthoniobacterales bacterium]
MRLILNLALAAVALTQSQGGFPVIGKKTVVQFLSAKESQPLITAQDDFVKRLSPFDRAARLKVGRPVSEAEYLAFVGKNVRDWTEPEIQKLRAVIDEIPSLPVEFPFPPAIQLIKTTGVEEGNAAYTRGTAIMIPVELLAKPPPDLKKLVCHEMFHILSRANPALREKLYSVIGFTECEEIELPPELASRKITNPDAPRNDHFIQLKIGDESFLAVPVLFSTSEQYDEKRGGEFFAYLKFQFLVVEKTSQPGRLKAVSRTGSPRLVEARAVTGFFERIGRNTDYIIHPEEILADNFALLVLGGEKVASPEILEKMKTILFPKVK